MLDLKHAHQILLVDKTASFDEVKYSYRKLVLELHPDKNKNRDNGVRFKKITDAYHFIKNQKKHSNSNTTYSHTYQKKQEKQKLVLSREPQFRLSDFHEFCVDFPGIECRSSSRMHFSPKIKII